MALEQAEQSDSGGGGDHDCRVRDAVVTHDRNRGELLLSRDDRADECETGHTVGMPRRYGTSTVPTIGVTEEEEWPRRGLGLQRPVDESSTRPAIRLCPERCADYFRDMADLTLDSLLTIENEGWLSLTESRGGDFYRALMTPEAVMVLVNGMVLDRGTVAASLNDSPRWDEFRINDARVVPVGPDVVALIYRARAIRKNEAPFEALMSSVYCLTAGEPRLALYQQTSIDAGSRARP